MYNESRLSTRVNAVRNSASYPEASTQAGHFIATMATDSPGTPLMRSAVSVTFQAMPGDERQHSAVIDERQSEPAGKGNGLTFKVERLSLRRLAVVSRMNSSLRMHTTFTVAFAALVSIETIIIAIQTWQTVLIDPGVRNSLVAVAEYVIKSGGGLTPCHVQTTTYRNDHKIATDQGWDCRARVVNDTISTQESECVCTLYGSSATSMRALHPYPWLQWLLLWFHASPPFPARAPLTRHRTRHGMAWDSHSIHGHFDHKHL